MTFKNIKLLMISLLSAAFIFCWFSVSVGAEEQNVTDVSLQDCYINRNYVLSGIEYGTSAKAVKEYFNIEDFQADTVATLSTGEMLTTYKPFKLLFGGYECDVYCVTINDKLSRFILDFGSDEELFTVLRQEIESIYGHPRITDENEEFIAIWKTAYSFLHLEINEMRDNSVTIDFGTRKAL